MRSAKLAKRGSRFPHTRTPLPENHCRRVVTLSHHRRTITTSLRYVKSYCDFFDGFSPRQWQSFRHRRVFCMRTVEIELIRVWSNGSEHSLTPSVLPASPRLCSAQNDCSAAFCWRLGYDGHLHYEVRVVFGRQLVSIPPEDPVNEKCSPYRCRFRSCSGAYISFFLRL